MYYCLCLGLEGRFRIIDNGKGQLETLRQRLWQILRDNTPERPDTLSPHWPGENTTGPVGWRLLPAWVVASVALLMGVLIYLWFVFALSAPADKVFTQIAAVGLTKTLPPPPPRQGPVRFAKFLEPEVRAGLVTVQDEVDRSIITLRGDGLFASGKATVLERYIPALQRIAEALGAVQGNVMVTGYTDNVPIRTLRYPSNVELSRDRAQNVMEILSRSGTPHARLRSQGFGDANPIVANNSPENRSRNRRVEIVLLAAPMMLEEP
jgi:type VI secretion system protein ImpK